MASFEEAKICPKCQLTGRISGKTMEGRTTVYQITCENQRCRWFDTPWIVGVNPDGTVQQRKEGPKEFPKVNFSHGQEYIDRLTQELKKPTGPGTLGR